jgi:hypothetical protein
MNRPRELQLMIWKRAPHTPRRVSFRLIPKEEEDQSDDGLRTLKILFGIPSIFHACYDARTEALQRYERAFRSYLGYAVYFNYEIDNLEIDHHSFWHLYNTSLDANSMEIDLPRVKNVYFYADHEHPTILPNTLTRVCSFFSQLKQLRVIELDTNPNMLYTGLPHIFKPDETSFRHDWFQMRHKVLRPIPHLRDRITEWTPPQLTIGTWAQWNNLLMKAVKANQNKVLKEGEMEWEPSLTLPNLDYVPLYGRSA